MARPKRSSAILETARKRLAGLKSISPTPDFGPNLKLSDYEQEIAALSDRLDSYNEKVASLDQLQNELKAEELQMRDKNKRMLSATGAMYGSDSSQYEQAGGTRTSERKSSKPKKSGDDK